MEIRIPKRGELIASLPLFIPIKPLQRPRVNRYKKSIYQPKENQKELYVEVSNFEKLNLDLPIIVDTYINFFSKLLNRYPTAPKWGDDDNLRKGISDALVNADILKDDRIILGGETFKYFGEQDFCLVRIYGVEGYDVLSTS